ncbi:MAG: hypothetical protein PHU04_00875 [Candidatus Peribacteraceae bacterium]|nr:hypothetical protein [Candidatus Peribacteraceae bacterium]
MSDPIPNETPDSTETAPQNKSDADAEVARHIAELIANLQKGVKESVAPHAQETAETYNAFARRHLLEFRQQWNALAAVDAKAAQQAMDELAAYFFEREAEQEGSGNFTLKEAHNMTVRDFDDSNFLIALLGRCMQEQGTTAAENFARKAKEFNGNRMRRLGFHLIAQGQKSNGNAQIAMAKHMFAEVLKEYGQVENWDSVARTLFEQATIHLYAEEWKEAAELYQKSLNVAVKQGLDGAACIARDSRNLCLLKDDAQDPYQLVAQFENDAAEMKILASQGNTTAQSWVSNTLYHQAEACLAAAKAAQTAAQPEEASKWIERGMSCCQEITDDREGYLATLAEQSRRIHDLTGKLQQRFLAIQEKK